MKYITKLYDSISKLLGSLLPSSRNNTDSLLGKNLNTSANSLDINSSELNTNLISKNPEPKSSITDKSVTYNEHCYPGITGVGV